MDEVTELNRCSFNWPESKSVFVTFAFIMIVVSCVAIIVMQHVFVFQNSKNVDYITGTYFTMVAVIMLTTKHVVLYCKRNIVVDLLKVIKNELWPLNSFGLYDELQFVIKAVRIIIFTYCFSACGISQILMIFPYVDNLPGQKRMPILCWYPYDINSSPMHEITYMWITYLGIIIGFGISSFDALFMYFQLNAILQLKLLKKALLTIDRKYRGIDDEEQLYKKIVFCIQYHQKLNEFYEKIQDIYETHNAFNILISGTNVCCLIYLLQNERNPIKASKLLIYLICTIVNLGIYCVAGSLIKSETEDLAFAIYNTGWEKSSPRFQKCILFMIRAAQEPRIITAGKLAEIGNMTLISVLKTAFSISVFLNDVNANEDQ